MTEISRETAWNAIVESLHELMREQEQELGSVTEATFLGADLGVASIDIIHLMVTLEDRFDRPLSVDELVSDADGQFRQDITLGDLLRLVRAKVDIPAAPGVDTEA